MSGGGDGVQNYYCYDIITIIMIIIVTLLMLESVVKSLANCVITIRINYFAQYT